MYCSVPSWEGHSQSYLTVQLSSDIKTWRLRRSARLVIARSCTASYNEQASYENDVHAGVLREMRVFQSTLVEASLAASQIASSWY